MIFNMNGSGGNSVLNFRVVGNPHPSNPTENTIWVNTDIAITSWHFCIEEPNICNEGDVWIQVNESSDMEFNALKKNGIMTYPLYVSQYIGGKWIIKDAKNYQGGEWTNFWYGELYDNGKEWTHITGNLTFKGNEDCYWGRDNGSSFTIVASNGDWGTEAVSCAIYWDTPIDLTSFNTLVFEGSFSRGSGSPWNGIGVWSATTSPNWTNCAASSTALTDGISSLDVSSLKGEYYCGVWAYHNGTSVTCKLLKLE